MALRESHLKDKKSTLFTKMESNMKINTEKRLRMDTVAPPPTQQNTSDGAVHKMATTTDREGAPEGTETVHTTAGWPVTLDPVTTTEMQDFSSENYYSTLMVPVLITLVVVILVCMTVVITKRKRRREAANREGGSSTRAVSAGVAFDASAYRSRTPDIHVTGTPLQPVNQMTPGLLPSNQQPQPVLLSPSHLPVPQQPPSYQDSIRSSTNLSMGYYNPGFQASQTNLLVPPPPDYSSIISNSGRMIKSTKSEEPETALTGTVVINTAALQTEDGDKDLTTPSQSSDNQLLYQGVPSTSL